VSLTGATLRSLEPTETQVTYWDKGTKSFGLRVSPGGTMTWTLLVGQERQRIKLGNYPIISLKDARILARQHLAERTLGQHRKRSKTLSAAYELFDEVHLKTLKTSTAYELRRLLKAHFIPKLGRKDLSELDTHHITDIIDRLSPGTAWHAFAAIQNFLNWCVGRRFITVSPLAGVPSPPKSVSRSRVLTDAELRAVWTAAASLGEFGIIVRLLITTGMRRGETAALQSSWLENNTLTIPAEVTKNGRQHTVPLSPRSLTLATSLATKRHLLPPYNAWSKPKKQLDLLSQVPNHTLHDLRRSWATNMARLGVPIHIVEKMLNHISGSHGGIVGIYQRHEYWDEQVKAAQLYEDWFTSTILA
jgi:integrase